MRSRKAIYLLTAALLTVLTQKPLPAQPPASSGNGPIIIYPNSHPELALPCPEEAPPPADDRLMVTWEPEVELWVASPMFSGQGTRLALGNDAVHVVWASFGHLIPDKTFIRSSFDRGSTWERMIRVSPTWHNSSYDWSPAVAAWDNIVHVVTRHHDNLPPYFYGTSYWCSHNAGQSWPNMGQNIIFDGNHPAISAWANFINAIADEGDFILHSLSTNGGQSFRPVDTLAALGFSGQPTRMQACQNYVYLTYTAFLDSIPQLEIFFQRSIDYGRTFSPPLMLSTLDHYHSQWPSLGCTTAGDVYVDWMDYKYSPYGFTGDILLRHSPDHGEHWGQESMVTSDHLASSNAVAAQNSQVHAVWEKDMSSSQLEKEIYYRNSENLGQSWSPIQRLTYAHDISGYPDLAIKNDTLHLVWDDARHNAAYHPFYRRGIVSQATRTQASTLSMEPPALPGKARLNVFPNPCNGIASVAIILPQNSIVDFALINLIGTEVTQIFQGGLAAGEHQFTWEGYDRRGKPLSTGIYLAVLKIEGRIVSYQKILLLK